MNYKSIIDISSIIWNPEDYDNNTSEYFKLKDSIINLLKSLKREKPFIVLRTELLVELISGFPFNKMPAHFYEFGNIVYEFLASIPEANRVLFIGTDSDLHSLPDIVKNYFNENTQLEASYLISYLHTERDISNAYFTFQYLHGSRDSLVTFPNSNHGAKLNTETIFADDTVAIETFFKKYRRIFQQSPKHHAGKEQGDFISPLSCFKDNDPTVAQKYLEQGIRDGGRYYNFDIENNVYIVFMPTHGNIYHGYDEADRNKVPSAIRRKFNK